jgi:hypothetical protein
VSNLRTFDYYKIVRIEDIGSNKIVYQHKNFKDELETKVFPEDKPTRLEKQYDRLEPKAARQGRRVVIWTECPTCKSVGEWHDAVFFSGIKSVINSPSTCNYCHATHFIPPQKVRLGTEPITECFYANTTEGCEEKILYVWRIKSPSGEFHYRVMCERHIKKYVGDREYDKIKKIDTFKYKLRK